MKIFTDQRNENAIGRTSAVQLFANRATIDNDLLKKVKRLDGGNCLSDYFTLRRGKRNGRKSVGTP